MAAELDETTAGLAGKRPRRPAGAPPATKGEAIELRVIARGAALRQAGLDRPTADTHGVDVLWLAELQAGWDDLDRRLRSRTLRAEGYRMYRDGVPCPDFPFGAPNLQAAIMLIKQISAHRVGWLEARRQDEQRQRLESDQRPIQNGQRVADGAKIRTEETMTAGIFRQRIQAPTMLDRIAIAYPRLITADLRDVGIGLALVGHDAGFRIAAGVSSYGERGAAGAGRGLGLMREGAADDFSEDVAETYPLLKAMLWKIKNVLVRQVVISIVLCGAFDPRIGYLAVGLRQLRGTVATPLGLMERLTPPEWDDRESMLLPEISERDLTSGSVAEHLVDQPGEDAGSDLAAGADAAAHCAAAG